MKYSPIPKTEINMCNETNLQAISPKFNLAQMIARLSAKTLIEAEKKKVRLNSRGVLMWWSTGSGKTGGASAIMNEYLDTDKKIIYATSVEAIRSNQDTEFYNNMRLYIDRFRDMSVEDIKKSLQSRIIFKSFAQMAHLLQLEQPLKVKDPEYYENYLQNSVLLIDEVQNLFQPIPNQQKEYDAFRNLLLDVNNSKTKNTHIYLLSATPGDTPERIVGFLNILRAPGTQQIFEPQQYTNEELDKFKQQIRGMVSYYNQNEDYTRFPKKIDNNIYLIPMSEQQYSEYEQQRNKLTEQEKDIENLIKNNKTDEYYKRLRRYSNSLLKWDKNNQPLQEYSNKMKKVIENVQKFPFQKHYIYSSYYRNFSRDGKSKWDHGVFALSNILTSELQFEYLSVRDCRLLYENLNLDNKQNREIKNTLSQKLNKGRRYIIATSTVLEDEKSIKYMMGVYNHIDNAYGEYIQIFLASQKYNEGLDFKSLRHIHFLEPLLMRSADMQMIGRGIRNCSHAQLKFPQEWDVKIHRYFSTQPTSQQIVINKQEFDQSIEQYLTMRKQLLASISDTINQIKQQTEDKEIDFLQDILKKQYEHLQDIDNYYFQIIKAYQEFQQKSKENVIDVQIMFQQFDLSKKINKIHQIMKESSIDCHIIKEVFNTDTICS